MPWQRILRPEFPKSKSLEMTFEQSVRSLKDKVLYHRRFLLKETIILCNFEFQNEMIRIGFHFRNDTYIFFFSQATEYFRSLVVNRILKIRVMKRHETIYRVIITDKKSGQFFLSHIIIIFFLVEDHVVLFKIITSWIRQSKSVFKDSGLSSRIII